MADRILILGAGVYQAPLIRAATGRGLQTVVASRNGPYPGIDLADRFIPVDITDEEGILAVAREFGVVAVATAGADVGLPALGRVVDELGLRGPSAAAAFRSSNKAAMKTAFVKSHVPSARFGVFAETASALEFARELGYPVIVKPADSSGSRGVRRVDEETQFAAAWQDAAAHSRSGTILVERFLAGIEFGAQAIVYGSHVEAVFLHSDTVNPGPPSTPVGHALPIELPATRIAGIAGIAGITGIERIVAAAVAALGLRDCIANVDLMLTENGPQVIEIGGRMGATGIPEMISLYTGWNIHELVLDLALGRAQPLPHALERPNAVTLLRSDRSGTIASLEVPDAVRDHPDLVELQWDVAPGDAVRAFRTGPDRIGQLQVTGATARAATELAEELRAAIRIEVQENS